MGGSNTHRTFNQVTAVYVLCETQSQQSLILIYVMYLCNMMWHVTFGVSGTGTGQSFRYEDTGPVSFMPTWHSADTFINYLTPRQQAFSTFLQLVFS